MTNLAFPTFVKLSADKGSRPLYAQVYEAVRRAILNGDLPSGTRLPATRSFADELGVSRITVVNAFDQLTAEGYLVGRAGAGTFVAPELPENLLDASPKRVGRSSSEAAASLKLARFARRLESHPAPDTRAITAFRNGLTAIDEFPFGVWEKIAAGVIRRGPRIFAGYDDPAGYRPLREAVAAWLARSRGVVCEIDQVFITNGAQQAIDLVARVLLDAGDEVAMEDPCYQEAFRLFEAAGARIEAYPVDDDGVDASTFGRARLAYVTPSHQYPSGAVMSLGRRLALLEWARRSDAWIVEDDYNSEFRYSGRPLPSLQNLDRDGRVLYVGTFSKTIFPGLRLGCLVVPRPLVGVFAKARNVCDSHSPLMDQAILAEFIANGHFGRHLRRMRKLYETRRDALAGAIAERLDGLMTARKSESGMHLVGVLRDDFDDVEVARKGNEAGLTLAPISTYCVKRRMPPGFVLGYTGFDEKRLAEGVERLRKILNE